MGEKMPEEVWKLWNEKRQFHSEAAIRLSPKAYQQFLEVTGVNEDDKPDKLSNNSLDEGPVYDDMSEGDDEPQYPDYDGPDEPSEYSLDLNECPEFDDMSGDEMSDDGW